MLAAPKPPDEERRLAALHALNLLDTEPEERFDRITRLAQRVFGTSIATFTLIDADRQWFKSEVGAKGDEDPRDVSFCSHAILDPDTTVVEDARLDKRFHDNPLVLGDPKIRFYAGHPVAGPGGEAIGTLSVTDDKPRARAEFDTEALREFAAMVEAEFASSPANGDELTGLANRRGFELLGERLLAAADRLRLPVSVIYADLDQMKPINDTYGHESGDRAVAEAAGILGATLRASDLVARLGGDEFCALLVGSAAEAAPTLIARVEGTLAARNAEARRPWALSMSLGVAEAPAGEKVPLWDLVALADAQMFEAKRRKKADRDGGPPPQGDPANQR
jgi:diguanylate cyclase (GGDEF)-like protein